MIAYALAGIDGLRLRDRPARQGPATATTSSSRTSGRRRRRSQDDHRLVDQHGACSRKQYADVFEGDERWRTCRPRRATIFEWDDDSTYVRKPPYFDGMTVEPTPVTDITGARVLAMLGDSVTTDHICPAGNIKAGTPPRSTSTSTASTRKDYNSYGSRRGNHEVMIRGTFANIRLKNQLLDGVDGWLHPRLHPGRRPAVVHLRRVRRTTRPQGIPLVVLGGKEYGSGSSRDWAAKGTSLLGVKAVITESFERIHRSNLIGMGVVPLQFPAGESLGVARASTAPRSSRSRARAAQRGRDARRPCTSPRRRASSRPRARQTVEFDAVVRIDTPGEADYYRNGGILQYVLRSLV